jgi:hypothetical protein
LGNVSGQFIKLSKPFEDDLQVELPLLNFGINPVDTLKKLEHEINILNK